MLTDLKFLQVGQTFPPATEKERLENYIDYKKLFEGKHEEVYKNQFNRIKRINNDYTEIVSFDMILNYHQLVTKKVADLLVGETPKITIQDKNKQKILDDILNKNDVFNLMYITAMDTSRYGVGLFYLYKELNKGVIDITQPAIWFPIVSPRNVRKIQYHVLCIPRQINDKETELYCEIHEKGRYTIKYFLIRNGKIVREFTDEEKTIETGLNDFAIIPVTNLITSDNIFGISDYDVIDTIVSELEVRFSQISKILDRHAEPSMQGPASALKYDRRTDSYSLKTGSYFVVEGTDGKVNYLTWDAQLEANFRFIQELQNALYTLSEMGGTILGDKENVNGNISGIAYKLKMETALQKVSRIRNSMDTAIRKAISGCAKMEGYNIAENELIIEWKDGLTNDDKEEAEIMQIKNGNKPTLSHVTSIMMANDMSREEAEEEYERIVQEEMEANPLLIPNPHLLEDEEIDEEINE
ncbi:phage portal protein [Paratissierella segnis]|uniref:Phage portal protein n=1 Tax=Paratissierella segnis TaxID=2763679 RepID=A0A926ESA4_9FIRM|nr:phage portal protein [Paratissierella segnis]MBC8586746.1 phage portal protein [Paratissierella segnis]